MYHVGLVLSGGGARGFAHAGAFKAFDELGVKPQIIAGTSAGSIAGALYASGLSPEQMLEAFKDIRFFKFPKLNLFGRKVPEGPCPKEKNKYIVLKTRNLAKILDNNLPVKTFEELKIPLVVNATMVAGGQNVYFTTGELLKPVVASSAIPLFFKPVTINGYEFVDGGVLQNLPVSAIRKACKYIVAIDINPLEDLTMHQTALGNEWERLFKLLIRANTLSDKSEADLFIQPKELVKYSIVDTKHGEEMFQIGYQATKVALEKFILENPDLRDRVVADASLNLASC